MSASTSEAAIWHDVECGSYAADLSYVEGAVTELARHLRRRALVVGKSTVPVGTAARLAELVRATAPAGATSSASVRTRIRSSASMGRCWRLPTST